MNLSIAIILEIVQKLTELSHVSSSAHLVILQSFLPDFHQQGIAFDAILYPCIFESARSAAFFLIITGCLLKLFFLVIREVHLKFFAYYCRLFGLFTLALVNKQEMCLFLKLEK